MQVNGRKSNMKAIFVIVCEKSFATWRSFLAVRIDDKRTISHPLLTKFSLHEIIAATIGAIKVGFYCFISEIFTSCDVHPYKPTSIKPAGCTLSAKLSIKWRRWCFQQWNVSNALYPFKEFYVLLEFREKNVIGIEPKFGNSRCDTNHFSVSIQNYVFFLLCSSMPKFIGNKICSDEWKGEKWLCRWDYSWFFTIYSMIWIHLFAFPAHKSVIAPRLNSLRLNDINALKADC